MKRDFISRQKEDAGINNDLLLSVRQQKAMEYVKEHGSISNKIYQEINSVSMPTATRDLAEMVAAQLLDPQGSGRSAVYILSAYNRLMAEIFGTEHTFPTESKFLQSVGN